ncbi:MAG: AAA family ATPase [bacterium]|nr:AAA family ATPase [bacterium]
MKIGFTGTMSCGKTTLVNALQELPELKDYKFQTERSKYLRDLGIPLNTDSTLPGQTIFLAERASEILQENIITDRTILDVMAFTEASKTMTRKEKNAFIEIASLLLSQYDHIFYIPHDGIKIEINGVRETNPEYRDKIDLLIRTMIKKYKSLLKNVHIIQGPTEDRISQFKQILSL